MLSCNFGRGRSSFSRPVRPHQPLSTAMPRCRGHHLGCHWCFSNQSHVARPGRLLQCHRRWPCQYCQGVPSHVSGRVRAPVRLRAGGEGATRRRGLVVPTLPMRPPQRAQHARVSRMLPVPWTCRPRYRHRPCPYHRQGQAERTAGPGEIRSVSRCSARASDKPLSSADTGHELVPGTRRKFQSHATAAVTPNSGPFLLLQLCLGGYGRRRHVLA
mmetsp:Transcript_59183/g.139552  ORF Transcript_59183/g.139552 Transcript_59183/m.139552 type:complete len:215 (-) Transcript_59183:245-889(-)